ncbi:MAG: Ig-like domain repeat protein [Candidatus Dormibacteraeota bacterium]|nr:Ig-like domain repeat protein [Candidatus Dormibacteraeota bacterium]
MTRLRDSAPASTTQAPALSTQCVSPTQHQHIELFYAHFSGQPDNYATYASDIASQFQDVDTNYIAYDAAHYFGVTIHLYVECSAGSIVVHDIALSTSLSNSNFSTIVNDMSNQGYTNPLAHYWIWTDGNPDAAFGYAGQSTVIDDDSAGPGNAINSSDAYSINYGYADYNHSTNPPAYTGQGGQIFAHENGHAMGAVQLSAPDTTGAWHCTDGTDVMCYNDGGPYGSAYTTSVCGLAPNNTEIFDCNFNDYFNPAPAPGSYLAGHWDVASPNNAWLLFQLGVTTTSLTPPSATVSLLQPVQLIAAVTNTTSGQPVTSGMVTFQNSSGGSTVSLGSAPLDSSGHASLSPSWSSTGTQSVTASYGGSSLLTGSTSSASQVTVVATSPSQTSITSSVQNNSAPVGTSLTFTAQVANAGSSGCGCAPAGTVTFLDGATVFAHAVVATNGAALVTTSSLPPGTHTITAKYAGDSNYTGSQSSLSETVTGGGGPYIAAVDTSNVWVTTPAGPSLTSPQPWSGPFYGSVTTLSGDVAGKGEDDIVAVNYDSVWVMTSNGTGFGAAQEWSSTPFYGTRATLLADVEGTGRADLIAVNADSVWVMRSTGSGFSAPQEWWSGPFYGYLTTLAGDVTGDGMADLVAVNPDNVYVLTSNGSGFNAPSLWSAVAFYGSRSTLLADATGSGREDLIAVNDTSTWVTPSTGVGFAGPEEWYGGAFYGSVATLSADLSGNGKVTLVAVDWGSVWAMPSTGAAFSSPAQYLPSPFYGTRTTVAGP